MKRILDLGCGRQKISGAIGIDLNPASDADVIHDLNVFPYPFAGNEFDEVHCDSVLEHLDNFFRVMEEIHRITVPEGLCMLKCRTIRVSMHLLIQRISTFSHHVPLIIFEKILFTIIIQPPDLFFLIYI